MKKIMFFIFVVFLSLPLTASVETSQGKNYSVLNLRGYKIGVENSPYVVITDAITESLEIVSDKETGSSSTSEIDVSNHVENFLGNINSASTEFPSDQVVFSYRVIGNTTGTFKLTLIMNDLSWADDAVSDTNADLNTTIGVRYDLSNFSYAFHGAYSNIYENSKIEGDSSANVVKAVPSSASESHDLVSKWYVTNTSDSSTTPLAWIHRGAVALTISSQDYSYDSGRPLGRYKSNVEVILSVE